MINFNSLIPPVNTTELKQPKRSEIAVAGSNIHKDTPQPVKERLQRKRRGRDRRKKDIKPLVDMRTSGDRRKNALRPSISIKV